MDSPTREKLVDVIAGKSFATLITAILIGIVSGLLYTLVIPLILYSLAPTGITEPSLESIDYGIFNSPTRYLAVIFFINCLLILIARSISTIMVTNAAKVAAIDLKMEVVNKIKSMSIVDVEKIGSARLFNLLTRDILSIAMASISLPILWINSVTVIGILGYLIYLNTEIFIFVLIAVVFGIITYHAPIYIGSKYLAGVRNIADTINEGVEGLIYGAMEIKQNPHCADKYLEKAILTHEKRALKYWKIGDIYMFAGGAYGDLIAFFVIGIVVFKLPYDFSVSSFELHGAVMALLYLTGPVAGILSAYPNLRVGKIALDNINTVLNINSELVGHAKIGNNWDVFKTNNVTFSYKGELTDGFNLKPTNLEFYRGSVTFIVGSNGSGKSTLAKLLSLHYKPDAGFIQFGETKIDSSNINDARRYVCSIYSNYYLFKELYLQQKH